MITGYSLLLAFAVSIGLLLISIIKLKMNPFLALLSTAIITAFMVRMPLADISPTIATGFGNTLKGIGIVIGLGIIFGNILSEARATEAIAKGLLKKTGDKHSALAINAAGFLISIPVFMDAAFVIMMPIVKYVADTTKKSIMMFICALGVGTIVGHALIIPTPGPLAVAANVNASVGAFIFYSIIVGFPASLAGGWLYGKIFENYKVEEVADAEAVYHFEESTGTGTTVAVEDVNKHTGRLGMNAESIPSFSLSMGVLLFPILLILASNIFGMLLPDGSVSKSVLSFLGDKNTALLLGVFAAMFTMKNFVKKSYEKIIIESADSAGLILLITGAGGAFGNVINASGIGKFLVETMSNMNVSLLVLGFILSVLLRVAQGSTTVAIVTTSSILGPSIALTGMSPVLVGLAICAGGVGFSLPNDSGFWVLSRFSGLSVKDTLKSWTVGGTVAGLTAFGMVLLINVLNNTVGLPGL